MSVPLVKFHRVSKAFGKAQVLSEIDFEIFPGQLVGLAGENGAGKTTLIKCMLDFCSADSGTIEINGLASNSAHARQALSFLPERFTPPWYLTGREFIRAALDMAGTPWDEDLVLARFTDLDLAPSSLDKPVRAFSKGMTQKLGLAACFLTNRQLLVLDEPMSGLDPSARARVKTLLRDLKVAGKALLFTSHSLADIEEICDHMAVLHRGSIAFRGSPHEMLVRYAETTLERAFLKCIESSTHVGQTEPAVSR